MICVLNRCLVSKPNNVNICETALEFHTKHKYSHYSSNLSWFNYSKQPTRRPRQKPSQRHVARTGTAMVPFRGPPRPITTTRCPGPAHRSSRNCPDPPPETCPSWTRCCRTWAALATEISRRSVSSSTLVLNLTILIKVSNFKCRSSQQWNH